MADIASIDKIRYFNSYDSETQKLLYSKYNFNFETYALDFNLKEKTKLEIFDDFLLRNDTFFQAEPSFPEISDKTPSYLKPTVVKEELKKYFNPMTNEIINYNNKYAQTVHTGYMNIQDPRSYDSIFELVKKQFDLYYYKDDQIRRLQDYYFSDDDGIYSKFNFDFIKYSNDFKVYGNNFIIFTDFISRVVWSSGTIIGAYGYGTPYGFKQYFIQSEGLVDYMSKYGSTSIWRNVCLKNEYNINYLAYAEDNNLPTDNLENAREHYLRWGQFKQIEIKFIEEPLSTIENNMNSICTILASGNTGTGFLYKNKDDDPNIYIVTCAHILGKSNLSTIKATFGYNDNSRNIVTETAEFRVMGRDIYTDIMMAVYDSELPYNQTFKPDLSKFKPLRINLTSNYKIGDNTYTIGNLGMSDNNSLISGRIIDPHYFGDFYPDSTYIPESILINLIGSSGISGAPIFKENNDKEVVGLVLGCIKDGVYTVGLSSFILENLLTNIIARWDFYSIVYKDDPVKLQVFTKNSITKKWMGTVTSYYNPQYSPTQNRNLGNFPYTGGLIIHDFILGFNNITSMYIFDSDSLTREGTTLINGPLLNSKMYNKFIDSGKTPIVLKSMGFLNGLTGQYARYNYGKYGNQDAYWQFTYGLSPLGYINTPPDSQNSFVAQFGKIFFEYYYYDGQEWILDSEELGGNDSKWYTTYTDALGNKYYQSKWEFPQILLTYTQSYIHKLDNSTLDGNGLFNPLGSKIGNKLIESDNYGSDNYGSGNYGSGTYGSGNYGSGNFGSGIYSSDVSNVKMVGSNRGSTTFAYANRVPGRLKLKFSGR